VDGVVGWDPAESAAYVEAQGQEGKNSLELKDCLRWRAECTDDGGVQLIWRGV
jgi:hypothetical protein